MKRFVCLIILTAMMLHCAGRLGIVQYLFEQRHWIAFHLGLNSEMPIAICHSEYYAENELSFSLKSADQTLPVVISVASEIQLFFEWPRVKSDELSFRLLEPPCLVIQSGRYASPIPSIFQPPRIS